MSDERIEHLEGLLTHPGFLLFKEFARTEWGPSGYGRKVRQAITKAREEKTDPVVAVEAVDYTAKEIDLLLSWPGTLLHKLLEQRATADREPSLSRRGPNL